VSPRAQLVIIIIIVIIISVIYISELMIHKYGIIFYVIRLIGI